MVNLNERLPTLMCNDSEFSFARRYILRCLSKAMKMTSAHLMSGVKSISFLARENHYCALKLTKWQCNANQELIMFVCLYSLKKEL